jgi:predicted ATPase
MHANDEAIRLFQKALSLLEKLPPSRERAEQALELNTALGVCLVASHGYPDSSVMGIYEHAIELCRQLGRPTEAPILRAHAIASLTKGDTRRAEALGYELLSIHAKQGDPVTKVEGHYVLGVSYFWMARFAESRANLEESIARFDPQLRETHLSFYAQDPKAICLCRLAWTLVFLGFPDQARAKLDEALILSRELKHPHTEAYVYCYGAIACLDMRDETRATELLDALEQLTVKHRFFFWENRGKILQCFLRAEKNLDQRDLDQADEYIATYVREGHLVNFSQFLGFKAQIYLTRGAVRDGLASIDKVFEQLEHSDERYYNPELHRLRGELLRAQGSDASEVEACYQQALHLSREQAAKICELRAAMSLSRLWQSQRKKKPAYELLTSVYGKFTEGFSSADLREARALLDRWK